MCILELLRLHVTHSNQYKQNDTSYAKTSKCKVFTTNNYSQLYPEFVLKSSGTSSSVSALDESPCCSQFVIGKDCAGFHENNKKKINGKSQSFISHNIEAKCEPNNDIVKLSDCKSAFQSNVDTKSNSSFT
ncbi:hypothetical protein WA026_002037 [Henosepilachna vigintioctopunctata]|uniref:Uncharacterized protein n=1 Tax=Henosepilachna vigintioctopunctata TaxID=420089 RepID=A0AAW1UMX4_9CUCU